jgi:hypothetical protein
MTNHTWVEKGEYGSLARLAKRGLSISAQNKSQRTMNEIIIKIATEIAENEVERRIGEWLAIEIDDQGDEVLTRRSTGTIRRGLQRSTNCTKK